MIRFNKSAGLIFRCFGGGKVDPSLIIDTKYDKTNDIRDKIHLPEALEADKLFMYEQSRVRRSTSLYNFFSLLPNSVISSITKLTSDTKVIIQSDDLYLPRLTKNGVPVYDSLKNANSLLLLKSFQAFIPFYAAATLTYPGPTLISAGIFYLAVYRPIFDTLSKGLVIKMELVPQTEEILVQRIGRFGCIKTSRYAINDLELVDRNELNLVFYTATKTYVDRNLIFRSKSTKQYLFFDPDGKWYEEGLNHELLI